jgi:transposase
LAALALGRLRQKLPPLELALASQCPTHHARLIPGAGELLALLDRQVAEWEQQIGEWGTPLQLQSAQLDSIPGVVETAARDILAEIGTDMSRFGTVSRLASWASLCPGNNESAGKRRPGRPRKGNRDVRRVLVPCAWATRPPPTFLGRTCRRLEARLGGKKAAMAVAHQMWVIGSPRLAEGPV